MFFASKSNYPETSDIKLIKTDQGRHVLEHINEV